MKTRQLLIDAICIVLVIYLGYVFFLAATVIGAQ